MRKLLAVLPALLILAACGGKEGTAATATVSDACLVSPCWMTGGGVKFDPVIGTTAAEHGPKVSLGGNVAPSCSLEPGQGGQWNHVDHELKWHFQGFVINQVSCSGVPTDSPDVTVNHIDFAGTGRLVGIAGNKDAYEDVCFTAKAEDWAEPGSKGQPDPALRDRYFIRVTDCVGNTLLVLGSETELVEITGGNIQIHPCM